MFRRPGATERPALHRPSALLLLLFFVAACAGERSWDVRGRVVGFGDDGRTVFVAHENIPGLMPAMTMPFDVHPDELDGLQNGDAIRFKLHANVDSSWISSISPLAADEPPLVLEEMSPLSQTSRVDVLEAGDPVPDVQLLNHEGQPFKVSDFRGQFVLVQFIYTRCPLPDYCPWMVRRFVDIRDRLPASVQDRVAFLSVTLDPSFDTPEVLNEYAGDKVDSLDGWWFATGDPASVDTLASSLGIAYTEEGDEIIHSLATALIDTAGTLSSIWRGNDWTIDEVYARLRYASGD